MRHRKAGRKLGRSSGHRRALYRNLITELFRHERIRTTEAKAKAVRGQAEKLITLGKRGDLHARRLAAARLNDPTVVTKLFDELADRYEERPGGYTRIFRLGRRQGDGASMVLLELVE
jgi:large subunit ribosomal protein L17